MPSRIPEKSTSIPAKIVRQWASALLLVLASLFACGQDTRNVTEPHIPAICSTLDAILSSHNGNLREEDEARLDTARIQEAIDTCSPGKAVRLRRNEANNVFLTGPLELRHGVTLLVDGGVILEASRDPRLYDIYPGVCGTVTDQSKRACRPLIHVADTDAALMGDGVIDGRGGEKLLHANVTWWDLAHQAKLRNAYQNCFRLLVADRADNFILYRITLKNSPNFHVIVNRTNGFTAWGVKIESPKTARNTDGIDPSSSTNVSILHSYIRTGDDNVAIKAGSNGPASQITVADDHFYSGHGMSIGSETNGGVSAVRVSNLTIDGADNGLRIKSNSSRGGVVHDVSYSDVCIRDVKSPIVFDSFYGTERGTDVPTFEGVSLNNVRILSRGKMSFLGGDAQHLLRVTLDGVHADSFAPDQIQASNARITIGPRGANFVPEGRNVSVEGKTSNDEVFSCNGVFAPFPANALFKASAKPADTVTVAADGSGDYRSLQEAVNALPETGGTIKLHPGIYREVIEVDKPNVRFIGEDSNPAAAVIVFDKSAGTAGGTFKSATVNVAGDGFYAEGLTIQNDFSQKNPTVTSGAQAVALSVRADRAIFRRVRLLGAQDTLFAAAKSCASDVGPCTPARQYFDDCYIEGHVDFIFGDSMAVFHNCEIHAISHKVVYLTAQSKRYPEQQSGFVFDHCKVTADSGVGELYFGRPWRPYSTVVFLHTDLQARVAPAGWHEWRAGETHSLETSYYAEYQSFGPGNAVSQREPDSHQLSGQQAKQFSTATFLSGKDGWNPEPVTTH